MLHDHKFLSKLSQYLNTDTALSKQFHVFQGLDKEGVYYSLTVAPIVLQGPCPHKVLACPIKAWRPLSM